MALHDVVVPQVQSVLVSSFQSGPLSDVHDGEGNFIQVGAIRYGEQFQVAQPPEIWMLNASALFPEKQGSELEQSDWQITLRCLYPFANDQKQAEVVLGALIEPLRSTFRLHLHLLDATKVARARIAGANWMWTVVNEDVYRTVELKLVVREKVGVMINP